MNCFDIVSGLGRLWARDGRHASRRRGVALGKPAWKVRIDSCLRPDITLCPRGRPSKGHPNIILSRMALPSPIIVMSCTYVFPSSNRS